jgi:lipopolysaccharide/colanic/teichoic acid biosynthesis glycosyltransferase
MKRLFDFSSSLISLAILSPILFGIAITLTYYIGPPIFYSQFRIGRHGRIFKIYKFRTMAEAGGSDIERLSCMPRFCQTLRALGLDELPQLWNILVGDMSLVGPRPLPAEYLPLFNDRIMKRHEVRPGLTGLAQVHSRNNCSWRQRFEYDLKYVATTNFTLDLQIIIGTILRILIKSKNSISDNVMMEPFRGLDD